MSRSKIFGMECIFGLDWKVDQIRPWILDTIEFFRPERCMFASHMPIAKLARSFQDLYCAYLDVVSEFSTSGKRKLAAVRMLFDFSDCSANHTIESGSFRSRAKVCGKERHLEKGHSR